MKKKISVVLATMVLMLALDTSAMAADSPSISGPNTPSEDTNNPISGPTQSKAEGVTAVGKDGQEYKVEIVETGATAVLGTLSGKEKETFQEVVNNPVEFVQKETGKKVTVDWYGAANISLPDKMPEGGLDITIKDSKIKAGDRMILLHVKEDGSVEEISVQVKDGAITGHFTSLSPVVYYAVASADVNDDQTDTNKPGTDTNKPSTEKPATGGAQSAGSGEQTANSPKTGEQSTAAPLYLAGMIAACGAIYLCRRKLHI